VPLQEPHALLLFIVTIHLLGLGSAWLARLSEGSRRQTPCQLVFLLALAGAAFATVLLFKASFVWGLASGSMLSILVIAATCDFRGRRVAVPV